ncbi:MAG: class I SAM-dependent methyltransferase [Nitrospirae bacterium]|nr:class I SAM-dependent methyltransferase [Nitrospirota bacterium]
MINQEKIWTESWEKQKEDIDRFIEDCNERVDILAKYIKKGDKILDAGCGLGQVVFNLLNRGYDAYGIDFSAETIKIAKEYHQQKYQETKERFFVSDIRELNFPANSFDVYVSYGVIEHFKKTEHEKIIKEAKRVLKNNGLIFLYYPNIKSVFGIQSALLSILGVRYIWQIPLSIKYVINLLHKSNFKIIDNFTYKFTNSLIRGFCLNKRTFKNFIPNPFYLIRKPILTFGYRNETKYNRFGEINIIIAKNEK